MYEKKKKDPDLPADSLALKTYCLFNSVLSDIWTIPSFMPSMLLIASKIEGAYSTILTSSFIVIVVSSSKFYVDKVSKSISLFSAKSCFYIKF